MLRKHFHQQPLPRAILDVIESEHGAHARLCSALQKAALCELCHSDVTTQPTSCNGLQIPLYVNLLFVYVFLPSTRLKI